MQRRYPKMVRSSQRHLGLVRAMPAALVLAAAAPVALAADPPSVVWSSVTPTRDLRHVARDGTTLWFGTLLGGVVEWDTATNTGRVFTQTSHGLPRNTIKDIAVDSAGGVWAATDRGVAHRPAGAAPDDPWIVFDPDNSPLGDPIIEAVRGDPSQGIWIGTFDSGLYHFDGAVWTHFSTTNSNLGDRFITALEFDPAGNLWVGVWGDGVDRWSWPQTNRPVTRSWHTREPAARTSGAGIRCRHIARGLDKRRAPRSGEVHASPTASPTCAAGADALRATPDR